MLRGVPSFLGMGGGAVFELVPTLFPDTASGGGDAPEPVRDH